MRRGLNTHGFTVVEVLVVLAITTAIAVSAFSLISGQQQKTEFNQAANDIQNQLSQIITNVATGYYAKVADFKCTATAAGPNVNGGGSSGSGSNQDCVFIGRLLQFDIHNTNHNGYAVHNLAGLRQDTSTGTDVNSIAQAKPAVFDAESARLEFGLQVRAMHYADSVGAIFPTGSVAFVTDFGASGVGSSRTALLYGISTVTSPNLDRNQPQVASNTSVPVASFVPATGASICFDGIIDKFAVVTMGTNNRQLSTSLQLFNTTPVPPECT